MRPHQGASFLRFPRTRLLAIAWLLASSSALATLGQAPSAARRVTQADGASPAWTLRQTTLGSGTTVHEAVRADGVVFAVYWSGPVLPDFAHWLGEHDAEFDAHLRQRRRQGVRGGSVFLANERLVLRSAGRMGAFRGHAYLPALVPLGVQVNEVLP